MSDELSRNRLIGYVQFYERLLDDMSAGAFYCEDAEGCLRRWFPPEPLDILKPRASTDDTPPRHSDAP